MRKREVGLAGGMGGVVECIQQLHSVGQYVGSCALHSHGVHGSVSRERSRGRETRKSVEQFKNKK